MVYTPKGGKEQRIPVFEFENGGGVAMTMYNTDEVITKTKKKHTIYYVFNLYCQLSFNHVQIDILCKRCS